MLLNEMAETMTETEMQDAVASKVVGCVLIVCMMALAMYMIYCWYKSKLAEEAARVQQSKWQAKQTDIAFKHLRADESDRYKADIRRLEKEIQRLKWDNKHLQDRLEQLLKAKVVADEQCNV